MDCSDEKNCGCSCHTQHQKCCCPCHVQHNECSNSHDHDDKARYFLELADEAWQEVLKEKIKEHLLKTQSDRMTKLAKIVAEGNNQRWRNRMEKKQGCVDFKEELCEFFSQSKK